MPEHNIAHFMRYTLVSAYPLQTFSYPVPVPCVHTTNTLHSDT
ncbi:hypothetical protein HMPREF0742_02717 [Rothia aeria F0184]|uniref:Uncharacterized protein n=1 Tax=Rothia aeria F0184 TaxID=888019 RepID=U7UUA5_9MICC|nr:hypothetical protein HMPREF0742_02717 [Rothia aeria F0184]